MKGLTYAGGIDFIVTKSIFRIEHNTVNVIETIQALRKINFEKRIYPYFTQRFISC
jgi:hypothetical protein